MAAEIALRVGGREIRCTGREKGRAHRGPEVGRERRTRHTPVEDANSWSLLEGREEGRNTKVFFLTNIYLSIYLINICNLHLPSARSLPDVKPYIFPF